MSLRGLIEKLSQSLKSPSDHSKKTVSSSSVSISGSSGKNISIINGRVLINGKEQTSGDQTLSAATGPVLRQDRGSAEFSGLIAGGLFEISWAPGPPSLAISAQESVLSHIEAHIDANGALRLSLNQPMSLNKGAIQVECSSAALRSVNLSGAAAGSFHGLEGDSVSLTVSGSAEILAEGAVQRLSVDASGASKLNARGVSAQSAQIDASGSSEILARFETSINATTSGASRASLEGSGEARLAASDSSRLSHTDGSISGSVKSSGAAHVQVCLTGACQLNASGSSEIETFGSAPTQASALGAGRITQRSSQPRPPRSR